MAKPTTPITPPSPPGKPGGLGEKVEVTIERFFVWLFNHVVEPTTEWFTWGLEQFMHFLRPGALRVFGPFLRWYRDLEGCPPEFQSLINDALDEDGEFGAAALAMVGTSAGGALIGSVTSSLFAPITYWINRRIHPARPEPSAAIAMLYRDLAASDLLKGYLLDLGWTEDTIARWMDVLRPRLGPADLFAAELRFGENPAATEEELRKRGYSLNDILTARALNFMIPGPGDLIRMAVREAWRDDVARQWGYDKDRPAEFLEWMKKQGDVDGWAEKYWRAHWELPGVTTGLEMLHRIPEFGMTEFKELLRISDIPETFRDYIARIAYVPLTRVDVRRMYGLGVLSRDEVKRNYLDLGYNDRDAERMTEFTVRFETTEDREATKADILSFYAVGALSSEEAVSWLQEIGYPADLAQYLVARETTKAERKHVDEQVSYIKNMYIHREIDVAIATTQLGALELAAGEITQLLNLWDIAREAKVERPSRATLDRLFKQDVITQEEYYEGLHSLGYQDRYKDWYVDSVLRQKAEDARKEEEAAREEQEAIRKRKIKSDYQIDKAGLDVDIAELQTAIAETQLALQERRSRYEEESRIAREALTVAQLEEQAAADIAALSAQINELREAIAFLGEQIETFQTEIAEIKLDAALEIPLLDPDKAARMIRNRQVIIEQAQDDIAAGEVQIAQSRSDIGARQEKLRRDIGIVERIRSLQEIEADYRTDLATMTARLSSLRFNLAALREQKAVLAVEYREGIAPLE